MGGGSTELSVESFGCGGLLGAVLGFLCAIRKTAGDMWPAVAVAAVAAVLLGSLAAKYGDRFWERFASVIRWFWW